MIDCDIQNPYHFLDAPSPDAVMQCLNTAQMVISCQHTRHQLCLRWVDRHEITQLNKQFRNKDSATNVLSFPLHEPETQPGYLGDIAISLPVVREEAVAYALPFFDHCRHLIVHGYLHLCDYDHETDEQAVIMQNLESTICQHLNIADPYQ